MNSRTLVLALLAVIGAVAAGEVRAQGFNSISSRPPPAASTASPAPVPVASPAFSSVSSLPVAAVPAESTVTPATAM